MTIIGTFRSSLLEIQPSTMSYIIGGLCRGLPDSNRKLRLNNKVRSKLFYFGCLKRVEFVIDVLSRCGIRPSVIESLSNVDIRKICCNCRRRFSFESEMFYNVLI